MSCSLFSSYSFKQSYLSYSIASCILLFCCCQQSLADELPGAEPFPEQLQASLTKARHSKGSEYHPRSEHLHEDGTPSYTNRLILEDSPYLLQHAHNPVNWHAWGEEAFEQARRQNKPVFLSIGYSTCHWCHVMEKESFESIEVARYLNTHFIAIKVDRERRPHVDQLYMTALLLIKGQGGWPMSSFLLANGKSFYSGTYHPRDEFLHLLKEIVDAWENDHDELVGFAEEIAGAVEVEMKLQRDVDANTDELVEAGVRQIMRTYDRQWGGLGHGTKFPNEASLKLLLQTAYRNQDSEILDAVEHSLMMMSHGGIYDHLAGGFHRYSTDPYWLVPHFEKMLYNQANLSRLYAQAYHISGNRHFKRVAEQTIDYVLEEMSSPSGGFYSASDADSEGGEGRYFIWSLDEIRRILNGEDAQFIQTVYGMSEEGNFEGKNILYLPLTYKDAAKVMNMDEQSFLAKLDNIRLLLLAERQKRVSPLRDEKIILAWNSMMITSLTEAAASLDQPRYLMTAIRAAEFLWTHQRRQDDSLWRVYYEGNSSIVATQDDYAFFAEALLALYDATAEQRWLSRAEDIVMQMIGRFADKEAGGFYMNENRQALYVSPRQIRDAAVPSGNAVAVHVLTKLSRRTRDRQYEKLARQMILALAVPMKASPMAYPSLLDALDTLLQGETGALEYSKGGIVKTAAEISTIGKNKLSILLSMQIAAGWHINSNKPVQDNLIPLHVKTTEPETGWRINKLGFPEPILKTLSFENKKLSLYEGKVHIDVEVEHLTQLENFDRRRLDISLTLQACNDEICLLPEEMMVELITPK
jgi:uncharacterized protein